MSVSSLRRSLLAFDDAVLATLASKGLLRRAGQDLAAGKVALVEERGDRAVIRADGEEVDIGIDGPAAAGCSCRAQGVCRHRIAAAMLLRSEAASDRDGAGPATPTAEEPGAATAEDAGDPLAEILALSRSEIAKWAGKATLRAAEEICDAAQSTAIEVEGAAVVVQLDPSSPEVRFLAGHGLAGMVSKAPRTKRKALHAAAILAVRRRNAVEEPAAEDMRPADQGSADAAPADREFLAQVNRCLVDCVRTGFNQAPLVLEERLFALSVSSRADALPRLSALLRTLAARVREKRERDFSLDLDAYLVLVAQTYALAQALLAEPEAPADPQRSRALRGEVRQDYRPVGGLMLYGMGARAWSTAAGARGVTGYFYAPEQNRWYSAGSVRANSHDSAFSPRRAYRLESLWGAGALSRLSRSRIELRGAAAAPDGRLSLSNTTSASVLPWPSREGDLADWSLAFHDWARLEAHLRDSFPVGLGQSSRGPLPVVLIPKVMAEPYFDDIAQETVWPLRDAEGGWLGLTLTHDDADRTAADLEQILHAEKPQAVAALASPGKGRFHLQPYALFLRNTEGGCHSIGLDPIRNAGVRRTSGLLRRLGRDAASMIGVGQGGFSRSGYADAAERTMAEASDALLGVAELGGAIEAANLEPIQALAARLQSGGLDPLARAMQRLDPGDRESLPPRLLEAVYLIDTARALLRPLPSLRPGAVTGRR